MKGDKVKGEITVFLTLILLLIISLVCTLVEGARSRIVKQLFEDGVKISLESELTRYDKDLWERYHIFALYADDKDSFKENTKENIMENMNYSCSNEDNPLLGIEINNTYVDSLVYLTDYCGLIFEYQAIDYMKYAVSSDVVEGILNKMNMMEEVEDTKEVINKKLEVEEKVVQLDNLMLQLLEEIEGIETGKEGITVTKNGNFQVTQNFVKQICNDQITKVNVGINHQKVFDSLKDSYNNPYQSIGLVINLESNINRLTKEIEGVEKEIAALEVTYNRTTSKKVKKKLAQQISVLKSNLSDLESKKTANIAELDGFTKVFELFINNVLNQNKEAKKTIDKLKAKQSDVMNELKTYDTYLSSKKTDLDPISYESFAKDSTELNEYVQGSSDNRIMDLTLVEPIIDKNISTLNNVKVFFPLKVYDSNGNLKSVSNSLEEIKKIIVKYEIKKLVFNYSDLSIEESNNSPLKVIKSLIKNGITSLVVDDIDELSQQKIVSTDLPSKLLLAQDKYNLLDYSDIISNSKEKKYNSDVTKSFESFRQKEGLEKVTDDTLKIILLSLYMKEHFRNKNTTNSFKTPSKLNYEQEYLIGGKLNDVDNLKTVITKILTLRTTVNFIYLLTNTVKRAEARVAAVKLVGFTGMAPLILLIQTMILLFWSYGEGLVDVRALLDGYFVPFFKSKTTFQLNFIDLLKIDKTLIKTKAKIYEKKSKKVTDLNYDDYIILFFTLLPRNKLSYRAMDLIQENFRYSLNSQFTVSQCIYGFKASVTGEVKSKFLSLPFLKRQVIGNLTDYIAMNEGAY